MVCTFFGHRDTEEKTKEILNSVLVDLIENNGADMFYVGNQGSFDNLVRAKLKELKRVYPHIKYAVVLAYMPGKRTCYEDYTDTIYPFENEKIIPRFAINKRNIWMINKSDYVITYVNRTFGGAAQFKALALKKGKTVIELSAKERL